MRLAPSFFAVHRLNSHWDGVILSRVVGECATKWRGRDCETHLGSRRDFELSLQLLKL